MCIRDRHINVQNYTVHFTLSCIVLTQLEVASHNSSVVLHHHDTVQNYRRHVILSSIILTQLQAANNTSKCGVTPPYHCTQLQIALYTEQRLASHTSSVVLHPQITVQNY